MRLIRYYHNFIPSSKPIILTMGNFDGVHLGHQVLLNKTHMIAKERGGLAAVLTFANHPSRIINNRTETNILITPLVDKLDLLKENKVDLTFLLKFNHALANMLPLSFIEEVIVKSIKPELVVTGHDFAFGKAKAGNNSTLTTELSKNNIEHIVIEPLFLDNVICSSSHIRKLLAAGEILEASRYLGYSYFIKGRVRKGNQRGRTIGFPTANIRSKDILWPKIGVYAAYVTLATGEKFTSMVNIGKRPTFHGNEIMLEAHLLNFDRDIYGQKIKVELLQYIREEKKFNGLGELQQQIMIDKEQINRYFNE